MLAAGILWPVHVRLNPKGGNKTMEKNFIDVTPQLSTVNGNVFRLGTVRYEVPAELIGELVGNKTSYHMPTPVLLYGVESYAGVQLTFQVEVSTDRMPQPQVTPTIPAGE